MQKIEQAKNIKKLDDKVDVLNNGIKTVIGYLASQNSIQILQSQVLYPFS